MKNQEETCTIIKECSLEFDPLFLELLKSENDNAYDLVCNGVGSPTSWTYHLTPDTIWFLDISASANIHDFDYTFPLEFDTEEDAVSYKNYADLRFYNNLIKQIDSAGGWSWVVSLRKRRAESYYYILQKKGTKAFFADKKVGGKLDVSGGNHEKYVEIYENIRGDGV